MLSLINTMVSLMVKVLWKLISLICFGVHLVRERSEWIMFANYHTHTMRCQHARGEDREYVEAAVKAGFQILGFSDHCPWPFTDGYVSCIRMAPADLDDYFYSLEKLRREYKNDITLYIGFEAEYDPVLNSAQEALFSDYPLDYLILGQHFLGTESESVYVGSPTRDEAHLKRYVDLAIEGIRTGKYLYLAHPDLIYYIGSDAVYEKHMMRLCQELKRHQIPIEINVLGMAGGRNYPSRRFLGIAQKVGNNAIIGVDAHMPEQLGDRHSIALAGAMCSEFGLPVIERMEIGSA